MLPVALLAGHASSRADAELISSGMTSDGSLVYLVKNRPTILQVSPPDFPHVIGEMVNRAKAARDALGGDLGKHIPAPFDQWEVNGVSCAMFEKFAPISSNPLIRKFQLKRITPRVLGWLRDVARVDRGESLEANRNLEALAACPFEALQVQARHALANIRAEGFQPRRRVMHGDLWVGNVLLDSSPSIEFNIIDWGGSNVDGFPIFDLVKYAESVSLSSGALRTELAAHANSLGCELRHTRMYLLAALGHIWLNLDQFPPERFAAMAEGNLRVLDAALNA